MKGKYTIGIEVEVEADSAHYPGCETMEECGDFTVASYHNGEIDGLDLVSFGSIVKVERVDNGGERS